MNQCYFRSTKMLAQLADLRLYALMSLCPYACALMSGFEQSKPFHDGVGLRQGCVSSPLFFIVYMNWIDKCSQADECATIGNCKISRLLFADDFVLLSSTESGLQGALNSFVDAHYTAGMKISTAKTEVLRLSRNPDHCVLQVSERYGNR